MENLRSTENPTPDTNQFSREDSMSAASSPEQADVDYKVLAKIIDKQLAKSSRTYVKELQKQFNRIIRDNQKNYDRLSSDNRRMLKTIEDLQSSQRHLQHQLELHQEREKLAVLREQQDVKRIRDLEDRLSFLLLAPVQNHRITIDESNRSEIAIEQAEIVETFEGSGDGVAPESSPEEIPTVDALERAPEENLPDASSDPASDTDELISAPRSEKETGDDPPVDSDDSVVLSYDEKPASLDEVLWEPREAFPFSEDKNIVEADTDENPRGMVDRRVSDWEEVSQESDSADDGASFEASPVSLDISTAPATGEGLHLVASQDEKEPAEFESSRSGDKSDWVAEPSTDEIETVGEVPPLVNDSTPIATSGSEEFTVLTEIDSESQDDAPLHGSENEPDGQQASSSMELAAAAGAEGIVITDDNGLEDDIIELQEEVSLEKPGIEFDDAEAASEAAAAGTGVEMPGMPLESDVAIEQKDAAVSGDGGQASDDDVDTSTFEIIELQEENIVTPLPVTAEDSLTEGVKAPVAELTVDNLSPEVSDSLRADRISGDAADADLTSDNTHELFKRGKSACVSKDYSQAAVYFDRFVELVPDEPRGHYNLAILYYRLKKYPAARTHAKRARELDYVPADRILRKIEAKLAVKIEKNDGRDKSIEASGTDLSFTLKEVAQGIAGMPVDDETLVYEPDILPNFNIDLSESGPGEDRIDEPYELLSPVEGNPPGSGLPEIGSAGKEPGDIGELNSGGYLLSEELEQEMEPPGMEKSDDLPPEMSVPMSASVSQDLGAEAAAEADEMLIEGNISTEAPGLQLGEEASASDSRDGGSGAGTAHGLLKRGRSAYGNKSYSEAVEHLSRYVALSPDEPKGLFNLALAHYRLKQFNRAKKHAERAWEQGYEPAERILKKIISKMGLETPASDSVSFDAKDGDVLTAYPPIDEGASPSSSPSDMVENVPEDAVETLDETDQGAQKADEDAASIGNATDAHDNLAPHDERHTIVDPAGMDSQAENLFEPQATAPELEEMTPGDTTDPLPTQVDDVPESHAAETAPRDDMVASSQEAIPASQYFSLAMTASRNKDYPEAIACFEKYVEQLPDEPKGHYNLAILHYRRQEYDKASEYANRALHLGGKSSQKIIDKIESKRSQENSSAPETSGDDALSMLLNDNLNFPASELQNLAGDDDTASIWDADELEGDISPSLIAEATADNSFGTQDDVIVFNSTMAPGNGDKTAKGTLPGDNPSLDDLKISALRHSPPGGSARLDAKADDVSELDNDGTNTSSDNGRLKNLFNLGQKAIESNEFLKAIKHFTKVTHLAPKDPRGYYYLAVVSCRLKFFETAREHATHAIELGSEPAKKVLEEIAAHQAST